VECCVAPPETDSRLRCEGCTAARSRPNHTPPQPAAALFLFPNQRIPIFKAFRPSPSPPTRAFLLPSASSTAATSQRTVVGIRLVARPAVRSGCGGVGRCRGVPLRVRFCVVEVSHDDGQRVVQLAVRLRVEAL